MAELREKGDLRLRTVPLTPLRDMVELRGSFEALTAAEFYAGKREDYVHITLTDEQDIPDALGKLRAVYHNLMKLDYDNARTRATGRIEAPGQALRSPLALFAELYEQQNNQPMSPQQRTFLEELLAKEQEA